MSVAEDSRIRYWDLDSGKLLQNIDAGEIVDPCDLSPDSRWLAAAGVDGNVTIWNIETGQKVLGPLHHERRIWRVRFSPNGRFLGSASEDRTARIWDPETGKPPIVLRHDFAVRHISFSADGTRVLTTTMRGPWRIWRVSDGEPVTPNITNASWANSGAFSPDGKLFAVLLNEARRSAFRCHHRSQGRRAHAARRPCYVCDIHARWEKTRDDVQRCNGANLGRALGKTAAPSAGHAGNVGPPQATSDDRHLLTSSGEGIARVWNLATGQPSLAPIRIGDVRATALAADGSEFLTGGGDGYVRRWLLASGAAIPLQFARNPKLIGVGRDLGNPAVIFAIERDRMQKIDLLTGRALGAPRLFPTPIDGWVGFAPDGQRFAVMIAGEVELWDLRGAEIARLKLGRYGNVGRDSGIDHLRFSADGTRFAIRDGSTLCECGMSARESFKPGLSPDDRFAFSPDGRQFAFRAVETARIWDFTAGRIRDDPLRHRETILGLAFSPDSRLLATASVDCTVQLWDARTHTADRIAAVASELRAWRSLRSRWPAVVVMDTNGNAYVGCGEESPADGSMIGGNDILNPAFNDDGTESPHFQELIEKSAFGAACPASCSPILSKLKIAPICNSCQPVRSNMACTIWSLPPQSGHQPVPAWLLRLATAFAGGEIDARAVFREQAFDAKAFNAIRRELATLPDTRALCRMGPMAAGRPHHAFNRTWLHDHSSRSRKAQRNRRSPRPPNHERRCSLQLTRSCQPGSFVTNHWLPR